MSKIIESTNGKKIIIDDNDYELVSMYRWSLIGNGYVSTRVDGKVIYLHRFLLNAEHGKDVDHANGNRLDNCRSNLRICSRTQNNANKIKFSNNKSGFKGVWLAKNINRYRAAICIKGISIHLGCFDKPEEAALAYDDAAKKYFGEFAKLNFGER